MRSTFKVLFFLKRDKQKANGLVPLFCRITVDGQEARFGMKCDVNPKFWDVKASKATGRTVEASKINSLVDTTKSAIYKIYREIQEHDNYVTAEKVKNIFLGIEQKHQTLLELFDYHNKERKSMIGVDIGKAGYECYLKVRQQVSEFLQNKYNLSDISIKGVDTQFLYDFEAYLRLQRGYSRNTLVGKLKKLQHIFELAVNKELIYKNPFKEYNLQWQKVDRGYLTQAEIDRLIDFKFEKESLEKVRDIFVFCSFTGLSYTDVRYLTHDNIQSSFDEKLWIKGKRKKTDVEYNIPLLNIPKMILDKYKGKTKDNLALPVYHIFYYNRFLKDVAKACGIQKRMSSHLARHTFATLTLTQGVSIESVSKMLGHANINTTQIYAKVTNGKVNNEMNLFAGNIKRLDAKMQLISAQENVNIEKLLQSLDITTGKESDVLWESLIPKVWQKLSNIDRQSFSSGLEKKDNKPNTMRDFYVLLINYFLDNIKNDTDCHLADSENRNIKTQYAVNF